jgi:fatty acid desaturase
MTTLPITKRIYWKDLTKLTPWEIFLENTITIPWLAGSWILAWLHSYIPAALCSVMFFLTALRQSHNGYHHTLGTGRKLTWLCLYSNSLLMLASMHAVKFCHLRHHKYCLAEQDHEGKCAKMKWHQAILYGPIHVFSIHKAALRLGSKKYKRDVMVEIASIVVFVIFVFTLHISFLMYHCIAMFGGEMLSAFFAVWTVHHDLDEHVIARTQRRRWKNMITYNMFYHLEHHMFPAVPTLKLPKLAKRIDAVIPDMEKRQTF